MGRECGTFTASGVDGKLTRPVEITTGIALGSLSKQYLDDLPEIRRRRTLAYALEIYLNHVKTVLDERFE
jgi:hypothetical protein